jgi:2-oxoisovalerate dehydrogenase E1 component
LQRALGVAFTLGRAHELTDTCPWPADATTVCSFGDASANHSTAVGAINAALNATYRGLDVPLLFLCEDNGIGISTKTAAGWIESTYANRTGLTYLTADGGDLPATLTAATAAADSVRRHRRPAFLHLHTVRLMGHAGSDYEAAYRSPRDITTDYSRDPVLTTARLLVDNGHLSPTEVLDLYEHKRATVMGLAKEELAELPQLKSAAPVVQPLTNPCATPSEPRSPHRGVRKARHWLNPSTPQELPALCRSSSNPSRCTTPAGCTRIVTTPGSLRPQTTSTPPWAQHAPTAKGQT